MSWRVWYLRCFFILFFAAWIAIFATAVFGAIIELIGGDSIGPNPNYTSGNGGLECVQNGLVNLGLPAVLVELTGRQKLIEFRVIGFPIPAGEVPPLQSLRFDEFMYQLHFWRKDDYLAGFPSEFTLTLPNPFTLDVEINAGFVVPNESFGFSGPVPIPPKTYDFVFDLTPFLGLSPPLTAGEWIIAFQSNHDPNASGFLHTAGSTSPDGLVPYFSSETTFPVMERGVLGNQDPNSILIRWGDEHHRTGVRPRRFQPGRPCG